MGLTKGKAWWWNFFKDNLFGMNSILRGHITLAYGVHDINIPYDPSIRATAVYLNCLDDGMPLCQGHVSGVSARLNEGDNSFTLHAAVECNTCVIKWLIEYESDDN